MYNISIIIPVYNGQQFLCECLNSVLKQDIENKEIICIDDGSTDQTINIIKSYQKSWENIRLIQQSHRGAAVARNRGLDIAGGKYVAFIDADDFYMDETGLRKMFEACEKNNVAICGSLLYTMSDDKIKLADDYTYKFCGEQTLRFFYRDIQQDYYYTSYIFQRKLLNDNNLKFPELSRYQDPPFLAHAMWNAKEFLMVNVRLYCYRKHKQNTKFSFIQINDILKGIKINIEFAKKHNLDILLSNNISRINRECLDAIKCSIMDGNLTALKSLIEIQEITEENGRKFEKDILALQEIREILKNPILWFHDYQIPFSEIPFGSRIILYGAGLVGRYVYAIIEKIQYCTIIKWVDQNYQEIRKDGIDVSSPKDIEACEAEYILVAIEKQQVFEEIKCFIIQNGWINNRKIVGPIRRRYE